MTGLGRILCVALASLFVSVAIAAADEQPAPPAPPAPVEAQPEPPAPPAPPPPPATAEDDDPMVCKTEAPGVGSHVRGRRVCKKKSEWGERPSGIIHLPDGSLTNPPSGDVGGGGRGPAPGGLN